MTNLLGFRASTTRTTARQADHQIPSIWPLDSDFLNEIK